MTTKGKRRFDQHESNKFPKKIKTENKPGPGGKLKTTLSKQLEAPNKPHVKTLKNQRSFKKASVKRNFNKSDEVKRYTKGDSKSGWEKFKGQKKDAVQGSRKRTTFEVKNDSTSPKENKADNANEREQVSELKRREPAELDVKVAENLEEPTVKSSFKKFEENLQAVNLITDDDAKPDWLEFKKQKKELRDQRRRKKTHFDVNCEAKRIYEKLKCTKLTGGRRERDELIEKVHSMLSGNYMELVLSHDMARVTQTVIKFGSFEIRQQIANELVPDMARILQSKFGRYCVKKLLKHGNALIRSSIIKAMYGRAVKLASHVVSAPIFEYAYSTWAQPLEKIHLMQEFFGNIYKQSKDDNVRHLKDVYKDSTELKDAALGATKANLKRIFDKELLDSGLMHSVMYQFFTECSNEDRTELITQVASHAVILCNSKDGARLVMQCFWNGSNKDRKVLMKTIKEHVEELSKHQYGHAVIIVLLDSADDTVLLNKIIVSKILQHASDIVKDEWGRKVLLWLVAPGDSTHFHPTFTKELEVRRELSNSKKSSDSRRQEILAHASGTLLGSISRNANSWLENSSVALVTMAALKTGNGEELKKALESVAKVVVDPDWKIKVEDEEISGIEHSGLHMILKKLLQHDKVALENSKATFSEALSENLDDVLQTWVTLNRGCFLLIAIIENGSQTVQKELIRKLNSHIKLIEKHSSPGSRIILKKLKENC